MLAKLTAKNQLTLPKSELSKVEAAEYFDVEAVDGKLVLTPCQVVSPQAVRGKLEQLGITEQDVRNAVTWARQSSAQ